MLDFLTTYNNFTESLDLFFFLVERLMTLIGFGGVLLFVLKKTLELPLFTTLDFKKKYSANV